MSNQQQISGNAPKNYSRAIHKRVLSALIDYLKRQRRCFTAAALILFVFFGLNLLKSSADTLGLDKYNLFDKEEIIGENLIEEFSSSLFTRELLNSGMDMAAAIMPTAHAGVDFSADDEMERYYFDTVEENGALISQSNPVGADIFSGLRRDAIMYDVQEGDTVSDLAVKFGLTSNTILWANNLREKDIIKPGQQLAILPINGVRIKAAKNDTLAGLAKKYNAKTGEIIAFNHLLGEGSLVAGNYIIIPDGEMPASVTVSKPKTSAPKFATGTAKANNWLIVPTSGYNWGLLHNYNAVDIANTCGTPVYAAAAGKIILADAAGWNGGYGKYIKIQHPNGVITLYSHASQLLVGVGDEVAQGQLIMLMGTTGRSTGCHLHFEVRGATNPLVR